MSQLSIIRLGSAGEIAGENIPPPPDNPTGSQGIPAGETDADADSPRHTSSDHNERHCMTGPFPFWNRRANLIGHSIAEQNGDFQSRDQRSDVSYVRQTGQKCTLPALHSDGSTGNGQC